MDISFVNFANKSKQYGLRAILFLSFCWIVSLPIIAAGYFSDDAVNSLIPGSFKLFHQNFFSGIWSYMREWLVNGRFFLVSVFSSVAMFYLFPNVIFYQIVRTIFIWLSIFSFAWLVRRITKNASASGLFILCVPLCWSIRDFPDPLTSFAIFLPLLTLFMALTLIFFLKYQETMQSSWLALSLILYMLALSTYELGIALLFLLPILIWFGPDASKHSRHSFIAYCMLTLLYLVINLRLRYNSASVYNGIEVGDVANFFPTFWAQLVSSLPLSYRLFAHQPVIPLPELLQNYFNQPYAIFVMGYFFTFTWFGLHYFMRKIVFAQKAIYCLILMGLMLMLIPAALIGVSMKYQHMISLGKGYISVYLQYIGFSLFFISMLAQFNLSLRTIRFRSLTLFFLSLLCACSLSYALILNSYIVDKMNDVTGYTRSLIEDALHHQLLAGLPENATIIEKLYLWNNAEFYMQNSHVKINQIVDLNNHDAIEKLKNDPRYILDAYHLSGLKTGYVIFGVVTLMHTHDIHQAMSRVDAVHANTLRIFIDSTNAAEFAEIVEVLKAKLKLNQHDISDIFDAYSHLKNHDAIIVSLSKDNYNLPFL